MNYKNLNSLNKKFCIINMMKIKCTAYIGIGSNIEPEQNIIKAFNLLKKKVDITGVSTFYRTKPLMNRNDNDYINGVWRILTDIPPIKLKFSILKKIEKKLKRVIKKDKYSSRTIDLDLLLYEDLVINKKNIKIPDPDIYSRYFIALPLKELDDNLIIPDTKRNIFEITDSFNNEKLNEFKEITFKLKALL